MLEKAHYLVNLGHTNDVSLAGNLASEALDGASHLVDLASAGKR